MMFQTRGVHRRSSRKEDLAIYWIRYQSCHLLSLHVDVARLCVEHKPCRKPLQGYHHRYPVLPVPSILSLRQRRQRLGSVVSLHHAYSHHLHQPHQVEDDPHRTFFRQSISYPPRRCLQRQNIVNVQLPTISLHRLKNPGPQAPRLLSLRGLKTLAKLRRRLPIVW